MKIQSGKIMKGQLSIGVYIHNWGYPVKQEWELGFNLLKWYIGIEFFK